jgi:hypothetical protein
VRGGDGLFEVEPVEPKRQQARPAAVDKRFRAFNPHQVLLLPPSLDDWLPEDHLARFVADLVDQTLDLTPMLDAYTEKRAAALLADAEATDAAEDERFGPDGKEVDLSAELGRREKRLAKL